LEIIPPLSIVVSDCSGNGAVKKQTRAVKLFLCYESWDKFHHRPQQVTQSFHDSLISEQENRWGNFCSEMREFYGELGKFKRCLENEVVEFATFCGKNQGLFKKNKEFLRKIVAL
jgi:hypothetical protein